MSGLVAASSRSNGGQRLQVQDLPGGDSGVEAAAASVLAWDVGRGAGRARVAAGSPPANVWVAAAAAKQRRLRSCAVCRRPLVQPAPGRGGGAGSQGRQPAASRIPISNQGLHPRTWPKRRRWKSPSRPATTSRLASPSAAAAQNSSRSAHGCVEVEACLLEAPGPAAEASRQAALAGRVARQGRRSRPPTREELRLVHGNHVEPRIRLARLLPERGQRGRRKAGLRGAGPGGGAARRRARQHSTRQADRARSAALCAPQQEQRRRQRQHATLQRHAPASGRCG